MTGPVGMFSELLRSKVLSAFVAITSIVVVYWMTGEPVNIFLLLGALIFPVACIWFPDELGTVTGISLGLAKPQITEPTPGAFVAFGGWILLLVIVVVAVVKNM